MQFRSKNRPNYVGFDDLKPASPPGRGQAVGGPTGHHPSAHDFGRNYRSAYSPARTSPQRFDILQRPEANQVSPRIGDAHDLSAPQQAFVLNQKAPPPQHMQLQMGAGAKHDGSERGNAGTMAHHSDGNAWLGSNSHISTAYEQNPEHTKQFQDFREQFESFYRGEPYYTKKSSGYGGAAWPSSSGFESISYAYHSDDEYVDNLQTSGNFNSTAVTSYKNEGAGLKPDAYLQASCANDPDITKEIDFYK